MTKRLIAGILGAIITAAASAGCSSGDNEGGGPAASGAKDGKSSMEQLTAEDPANVEGSFTYWSFTDSANNLVNAFNEKYPKVDVDLKVFGGDEYKTKILTAMQSNNNVPDVFDLEENYMYEFMESDLVATLSFMDIEERTKDYYDFQTASMKDSKGNIKGLTFQSSPVCFWYLRDAAKTWLGTDNPDELSEMFTGWDDVLEKSKEVSEKSNQTVSVWPNIMEMVKVDAFSFEPLVKDGALSISDDWYRLIDNMRMMNDSGLVPELGSWSSEWATAWNEGSLLLRAMPSWDFFTDWDVNKGNVGVFEPFRASFEGATATCIYDKSEHKNYGGLFLGYVASDEFQAKDLREFNQVPASKAVCDKLAEGFSSEDFGGQNLLETYSKILDKVPAATPDKYTRATQNLFQKEAADGVKAGKSNDEIIEALKGRIRDQYPEVVMD